MMLIKQASASLDDTLQKWARSSSLSGILTSAKDFYEMLDVAAASDRELYKVKYPDPVKSSPKGMAISFQCAHFQCLNP